MMPAMPARVAQLPAASACARSCVAAAVSVATSVANCARRASTRRLPSPPLTITGGGLGSRRAVATRFFE